MECKERLAAFLGEHGVPFETQVHEEAVTAQHIAAAEHISGKMLAKVVMVLADGKLTMLALPAPHVVDLSKASVALGAQDVRLAEESEFSSAFPDCEVGAMPPFGNLYDLPTYVDQALAEDETIVFNAGTHTETMSVKFADYERVVKPQIVDFGRRPGG